MLHVVCKEQSVVFLVCINQKGIKECVNFVMSMTFTYTILLHFLSCHMLEGNCLMVVKGLDKYSDMGRLKGSSNFFDMINYWKIIEFMLSLNVGSCE